MSESTGGISVRMLIAGVIVAILVSSALSTVVVSLLRVAPQGETTGYYSIPGSAFVPRYSTQDSEIAYSLRNRDTVDIAFYAPIQLPQGAVITNVTSNWYDGYASEDIYCQ
ncbi:MAG: hypothetical protein CW716_04200, partial [Candidatus Bathyarchaeum sp.]